MFACLSASIPKEFYFSTGNFRVKKNSAEITPAGPVFWKTGHTFFSSASLFKLYVGIRRTLLIDLITDRMWDGRSVATVSGSFCSAHRCSSLIEEVMSQKRDSLQG